MDEERIQKPITVARADFVESITNVINESMLPPFILEPILKDMYMSVKASALQQLQKDRREYQQALNSATTDGD